MEPERDGERVIDRSGDIDQRPAEERTSLIGAEIVPIRGRRNTNSQHEIQTYRASLAESEAQQQEASSAVLAGIAQRLQKELDSQFLKSRAQLEALSVKIDAQEKRCLPPKLDDDIQQIRFQRQKVLIANGPVLADCIREERNRLADLERFKAKYRLAREAHYPASQVLAVGVLLILIIFEAGINGVLFADSSDQGLLGGWLEALILSLTNVGAAFLFGRVILPQLHRSRWCLRAGAMVLTLTGVAVLSAINLTGAHYRDFRTEVAQVEPLIPAPTPPKREMLSQPKSAGSQKLPKAPANITSLPPEPAVEAPHRIKEREALAKILEAPLKFDSFLSVFLFVIGLCCACIAALDGYKFDDPFPGYGKCHRRYAKAREKSTAMLRRILNQTNGIMAGSFQAISGKLANFAQEMAALLALHHTYAGEHQALQSCLDETARDAESEIGAHDRLINKVPGRETADIFAIAAKQLPPLSERQLKFFEAQDRKLKALQKSAQKEQSDVLGIFDAASADFQRLLAEASSASLHAAHSPPYEAASEKTS